MSRSYKHTPRAGDQKSKFFKNYANRRLRRMSHNELPLNYSNYKKHSNSWDICDYEEIGTSFNEYWRSLIKHWHEWKKNYGYPYPDKKKARKEYYRYFLRK